MFKACGFVDNNKNIDLFLDVSRSIEIGCFKI